MRKKAIVIVAAAVALVAAACLWRSWVNSSEAARDAAQAEEAQQQEEAGGRAPVDVELDEDQRKAVASYTSDMEYVAEVLEGNLWESAGGSYAEFSRGGVAERAGEESKSQAFVITAVEHEARSDGSGGSVDVWTGSAVLDSGEAIFALSQSRSADAGDLPWELTCSGLALSKDYRLVKRSGGIEVSDLSAAYDVIGGEKGGERVASALEEHVAKIAPTATKATWDGRAEIDFGSGRAVLAFELDDSAKTVVEAAVSMETGETSFQ